MTQKDLSGIGEINALLGRGTEYEGKLVFEGRVRIDGRFKGEIVSDDLLILGEGADVEADVHVGTLIVRGGQLSGKVEARQLVEIHAPGRVVGDITTPQLFIDKGVVFEGRCSMGDAPTAIHDLAEDAAVSTAPAEAALEEPAFDELGTPAEGARGSSGARRRKNKK